MSNFNYLVNVLLKDNNIFTFIKNLQANFTVLDNRVSVVNQTFNQVTNNITQNITQVNTSVVDLNTTVSQTADNVQKKLGNIDFNGLVETVNNVTQGFQTLSGSGAGFEQSMANLSAAAGITGSDLEELNRVARESGKATGIGATEAANAFTDLASKVQVNKVGLEGLKSLQKETITLSQAGGISMAESASALTDTINQFGLSADQAGRVVNLLAAGSQNGSAGITDLAASLNTAGTSAAAAGISVEEAAGALEVLSQNNQKGAEAGTALSDILTSMQSNLNIDLSQNGLSTALESLAPLLGNTAELSRLFGESNVGTAQYLIENAAAVGDMTTALTETNTAQDQAAIKTSTTEERLKQYQATIDDYKISLFEATGGVTAYAGALGENLVMFAQVMPLVSQLGVVMETLKAKFLASSVATAAHEAIQKTAAAGTRLFALAQQGLNTALKANPIGAVVAGVTLLITGVTLLYEHFEGFRKVVDSVVDSVKSFFGITGKAKESSEEAAGAVRELSDANEEVAGNAIKATDANQKATTSTDAYTEANQKSTGAVQGTAKAVGELNKNLGNQDKQLKLNLNTLGGVEEKLSQLRSQQKQGSLEEAIELGKKIKLLEAEKELMERNILAGVEGNPDMKYTSLLSAPAAADTNLFRDVKNPKQGADGLVIPVSVSSKEIETAARETASKLEKAFPRINPLQMVQFGLDSTAKLLNKVSGSLKGSAKEWTDWGSTLSDSIAKTFPKIQEAAGKKDGFAVLQQGLETCGVVLQSLSSQVGSSTKAWVEWGDSLRTTLADVMPKMKESFSNEDTFGAIQQGLVGTATVMQGLKGVVGDTAGAWLTWGASVLQSVAQAIPQIIALTNTQIASATAQVTANTAAAGTGAASSVASIPIVGWIMAGIAVASVIATLATLPKPKPMATGGIVYGNLLAHVGEYPGAANNPEVVAPLNKLRSLIQPAAGAGGIYEFRLRGRDFVAVAAKYNNIDNRTR